MSIVLNRIREFIETESLFTENDHILVGYSGGADSTCLLHALHALGFRCSAAYLHHGQRAEADLELEGCEAFANQLGIPFIAGRADVPGLATQRKIGLEEAGREARYEFFEQAAKQSGSEKIATAHTSNDHAETVILNLTRGTGLKGLRGIPRKRDMIVRPLLSISRAETEAYCKLHCLEFVSDPANDDLSFSRVRVRRRIVPELESINPELLTTLMRNAAIVAEEDQFLDGMAAAALEQAEWVPNQDLKFLTSHLEFWVDRNGLGSLPAVLFKRAVKLGVQALGGQFHHKHIELVVNQVTEDRGSVTSPDEWVSVSWNASSYHFKRSEPTLPFRVQLDPGELVSDALNWRIAVRVSDRGLSSLSLAAVPRSSLETEFPLSKLRRPLYARSRIAGDQMTPLGFGKRRKVSDLLSESGLSILGRERIPVICDLVGPIWIPGVCLDERMSHNLESNGVMVISFGPS